MNTASRKGREEAFLSFLFALVKSLILHLHQKRKLRLRRTGYPTADSFERCVYPEENVSNDTGSSGRLVAILLSVGFAFILGGVISLLAFRRTVLSTICGSTPLCLSLTIHDLDPQSTSSKALAAVCKDPMFCPELEIPMPLNNETSYSKVHPVILHWVSDKNRADLTPIRCEIPVLYTSDEHVADAVLWTSDRTSFSRMDAERLHRERPWQVHAFWSLEGASYYHQVQEARKNMVNHAPGAFDLEMTYRTGSDVPLSYAYYFMDFDKAPLPWEERRQDRIAAAFISNCGPRNNRSEVLDKLMELLPGQIDSFGACRNNAELSEVEDLLKVEHVQSRMDQKANIISRYKMVIAFENSDEEDYVTEKYWEGLAAGSIPLHLGQRPGGLDKFLPGPKAALNVRDFSSIEAFAEHIKYLSENKEAWEEGLRWKTEPRNALFEMMVKWGKESESCRLAKLLRGMWSNPYARPATGEECWSC